MRLKRKIKEKDLKLDIKTESKYINDYNLSNFFDRKIPWKYGNCMILDKEKLLFSMYYTYNGSIAEQPDGKNWYGLNRFIFHIVEVSDEIIIKYLNLRKIDLYAENISYDKIDNMYSQYREEIGLMQQEYKDYIRNEKMKCVKIDKKEFKEQLLKLSNINYDTSEYFSCNLFEESIDYYDYVNKTSFFADRFYNSKYKTCINFIDYILEKCNILNMEKTNLKPFNTKEEEKEIMINLIKEYLDFNYILI